MHSPEQALDFLAIDASALTPVLGAEIEWKADQTTKYVEEDAKILRDVWGEPQVPEKGHVVAALYDLGRLLMVNPPYMVLEVYPPADGVGLLKAAVERMYRRADLHRRMGELLLSISRGPEFIRLGSRNAAKH